MKMLKKSLYVLTLSLFLGTPMARSEVMLQWFETEWEEMYRRLIEAAEIGYDNLWIPPPTKGPTGSSVTWANVGYNLYDRFDLGQIPQRGSLETRYGTLGDLNQMVDNAHSLDISITPDIVMNHNGNGPNFLNYPGMIPEDFHVQYSENYANDLDYKRGPRMTNWSPWGPGGEGTGATLWEELAQLIDIRTEDSFDPGRFTGGNNTPGWNLVAGQQVFRHRGQPDKYPYYPSGYTNENAAVMLYRWIAWLGNMMDYDGLRLDAGKHTPWEFFGTYDDSRFLHEAQWNFGERRGIANSGYPSEVFQNDIIRKDALIFAEILSPWSEIEYWYGFGSNDRNPMRFLDYGMKKHADAKFNGDMNGLGGFGSDFGPNNGILYVWGHDEGGASKINLAYAYILTHIGMPMVYFTGNNIQWDDHGREPWPNALTWMIPGYDSQALGDQYNDIPNLVWIHDQFAWGSEHKLWENDGDYFALQRYYDADSNGRDPGDAIMIAALNDSGWNQGKTLTTDFDDGTILKDYTGHAGDVTVGSGGQVYIEVPGNGGQGWVCYAPKNADPISVDFSGSTTMDWIVPGGVHASDKPRTVTRITDSSFTMTASFGTPGGAVDNAMFKWGRGTNQVGTGTWYSNDYGNIVGHYEEMSSVNATSYNMNVTLGAGINEGLNSVKVRVFNARPAGYPALFNTITEVVYVDRWGPELDVTSPGDMETLNGDGMLVVQNPDYTAYDMTFSVNGGGSQQVHEVMKGLWKASLTGLSAGTHTVTVTATEADWGSPRTVINTSSFTRVFSVAAGQSISISHADGSEQQVPFFKTSVEAPGASDVRLVWDGIELPFNSGSYTNTFNQEVQFRDALGVHAYEMWGNFVNGQHFFEAVRVDGGVTSRAVARVNFNLYGGNHIDTDGDSIPDNVEMPFFDQGAPGPDQPWPGDDNDFIPEWGETWTRLNVYNHSTFFSGQWDDQNDFDGDGKSNYEEVYAGYLEGNIYNYNIYDAGSTPTGAVAIGSMAGWTPSNGVDRGSSLTITYYPNEGSLSNASPIVAHIGHSGNLQPEWQDTIDTNMTDIGGGAWQLVYTVPTNATSVDFTFQDGMGTWDGKDWRAVVNGDTQTYFSMDGTLDSQNYLIFPDNMRIHAAVRGVNLYVATWAVAESGGGNDHFIYVGDELGDATDPAQGWGKDGVAFFDTATKPVLVAEGENDWESWVNASGNTANDPGAGNTLEGELNILDTFGTMPDALYMAAAAFETGTGVDGELASQGPYGWDGGDGNLDIMEFLRVPLSSITDADSDGYFDCGRPDMWTVVDGGDSNDANYGLRRFFLDEVAGDSEQITVYLKPNINPGETLSDVELFTTINRRDFAALPGDEDWDLITTDTKDSFYRAYPMNDEGGGVYSYTLDITKCGAYRINARYKADGGSYCYYADNGLRRETAVVVSPKKALNITMYEVNPMTVEATDASFAGRSTFEDVYTDGGPVNGVSTQYFTDLGVNMLWLQPIHPIGSDNRDTDPETGQPYDPGSPYAVRNYFQVNPVLGDQNTRADALDEFTNFVQAMDGVNVGVMLDGTFNHSAWDCEIGEPATSWFDWATNAAELIRDVRPQWYSKVDSYGEPASYYASGNDTDIAPAPDRIDFGKWEDAAEFYFGTYDALVQEPAANSEWTWSSQWYSRYLLEEDRVDPFPTNGFTKQLWQYFSEYPLYWLEKTGHPDGTPKNQSNKGIDGLRCDFAQGLPNLFWEYTINKTRSVKWDFLFMAESLDGYRTVNGSTRHGVGFRSSRHFDILNENFVFYWRDQFFNFSNPQSGTRETTPTQTAYDQRRLAFDDSPVLLNLSSHDETLPTDDQWALAYGYSEVAALDGVPMIFYGQEAGLQNDASFYTNGWPIQASPDNNFAKYESNFGKNIPNFKKYNEMTNVWDNINGGWADNLHAFYQRINAARLASPALRSQGTFFIADTNWVKNEGIFSVAKYEQPGVSASSQDVVFVFVNNDIRDSTNRAHLYNLDQDYQGNNWFGIEDAKNYNVVDLLSTNPAYIWGVDRTGADIKQNGLYVGLTDTPWFGGQAQYLKLVDTAVGINYPDNDNDGNPDFSDPDDDNDGMPDWWEIANGLDPNDATGTNGGGNDNDGDGQSNVDEYFQGTDPGSPNSALEFSEIGSDGVGDAVITWQAVADQNYRVECTEVFGNGITWSQVYFGTAFSNSESIVSDPGTSSTRFYRVIHK